MAVNEGSTWGVRAMFSPSLGYIESSVFMATKQDQPSANKFFHILMASCKVWHHAKYVLNHSSETLMIHKPMI